MQQVTAHKPKTPRGVAKKLATYRAKRDFDVTPEPAGEARPTTGFGYLIQKHAARRLHYDFRLELDGVLLSWAVPKGPSLDPKERRLAVRTEDHPIEYGNFEGVIPNREYGAGTVMLWDRGSWRPLGDARESIEKGHLTFELDGDRLKGRWHLVRTRGYGGKKADNNWLLFKGKDEEAKAGGEPVQSENTSVTTGRTMEEIAEQRDRTWSSEEGETTSKKVSRAARPRKASSTPLSGLVSQLPTTIAFTNLDKVLYRESGLTKAALIAYWALVERVALPLLSNRPLTLVRCPNGAEQHCFFQKHSKDGVPPAIARVPVQEDDGSKATYMAITDRDGLFAAVQLGALELHTWGCHIDDIEKPDLFVMDLDPDPALPFREVVRGALELRALLEDSGLESWVKTTGGKGLHVCVPIARRIGWDDLKNFTKGIATALEETAPARYTVNPLKARRKGKIFVDYLRNGRGATAIAPYSTRARAGAPVATPLSWDELTQDLDPQTFTIRTLPERLDSGKTDPWRDFTRSKQTITAKIKKRFAL